MYCKYCKQDKSEKDFFPYLKNKCKDCKRESELLYFKTPEAKEKKRQRGRDYYYNNIDKIKSQQREIKALVMSHYGTICQCCGESELDFLTIDHPNGDGASHRKRIGLKRGQAGTGFYYWLKNNNFPPGFQVLCYNCNCAKRTSKVCPHKKNHGGVS